MQRSCGLARKEKNVVEDDSALMFPIKPKVKERFTLSQKKDGDLRKRARIENGHKGLQAIIEELI
jgi:hypothetical protein